jgi:hypothetical protein
VTLVARSLFGTHQTAITPRLTFGCNFWLRSWRINRIRWISVCRLLDLYNMKIIIRQEYNGWLAEYPFSRIFEKWLASELGKRLKPSHKFQKSYGKGWSIAFVINADRELAQPKIWEPGFNPPNKKIEWRVSLPFCGCESIDPTSYSKPLRLVISSIATMVERIDIDPSKVLKDMPALVRHFESDPIMVNAQVVRQFLRKLNAAPGASPTTEDLPSRPLDLSRSAKRQKAVKPKWKLPKDLNQILQEDGVWDDERFDPILLTVMSGTSYGGRKISLAWWIEFDPYDKRLQHANKKIEQSGIEPDGDGWSEVVITHFAKRHPKLADELHSDSESSTCVLWVESEHACQLLINLVWSLI